MWWELSWALVFVTRTHWGLFSTPVVTTAEQVRIELSLAIMYGRLHCRPEQWGYRWTISVASKCQKKVLRWINYMGGRLQMAYQFCEQVNTRFPDWLSGSNSPTFLCWHRLCIIKQWPSASSLWMQKIVHSLHSASQFVPLPLA